MNWYKELLELSHKQNVRSNKAKEKWIVEMVAFAADLADMGYEEEEIVEILKLEKEDNYE